MQSKQNGTRVCLTCCQQPHSGDVAPGTTLHIWQHSIVVEQLNCRTLQQDVARIPRTPFPSCRCCRHVQCKQKINRRKARASTHPLSPFAQQAYALNGVEAKEHGSDTKETYSKANQRNTVCISCCINTVVQVTFTALISTTAMHSMYPTTRKKHERLVMP